MMKAAIESTQNKGTEESSFSLLFFFPVILEIQIVFTPILVAWLNLLGFVFWLLFENQSYYGGNTHLQNWNRNSIKALFNFISIKMRTYSHNYICSLA